MSQQFLITEGNVFQHEGKNYVLKSRGLVSASVEGVDGEIQLSKEQCPSLFQEILVG